MANQYQIPQIQPMQYGNQQQYQIPQVQQTQQPQYSNLPTIGVFYTQGLEGAKGFQINLANAEAYLRDAEDNEILYIKTTDQYGRPKSLERYRLIKEEIKDNSTQNISNFVTVDQLNDILDEKLDKLAEKFNKPKNNRNNGSRRNNRRDDYDDER